MKDQLLKEAERLIKAKAHEAQRTLLPQWDLEDLEQEGRLAALRAAKNYEKDKGVLFTTFVFPYLTRTYLSIYAYETCPKRSIVKQLIEDSKEMEGRDICFPTSYKTGTTYNLDRIFIENDSLAEWKDHPVMSETKLQTQSAEEMFELKDLIEKVSMKLDEASRYLFNFLISPPLEFTKNTKVDRFASKDYCEYLGLSLHSYTKSIGKIKKEIRRQS